MAIKARLTRLEKKADVVRRRREKQERELDPRANQSRGLMDTVKYRPEDFKRDVWALITGLLAGEIRVLHHGSDPYIWPLPEAEYPSASWVYTDGNKSGQLVGGRERHYSRVYAAMEANSMMHWLKIRSDSDLWQRVCDEFTNANAWANFLLKLWKRFLPNDLFPQTMIFKGIWGSWQESENADISQISVHLSSLEEHS